MPDLKYTTDNAAMIAMAGWFRIRKFLDRLGKDDVPMLAPDPNWKLGEKPDPLP
jgi:tRNA A37 threonylcarbamoyltransferase TsaD